MNTTIRTTSRLISILSLLFQFFSPADSLSGRCNPNDQNALLQIKQTLGGKPTLLATWVPHTDCCNWSNVECDPNTNRIMSITIYSINSFSGQFPAAVGDLPYLEVIIFSKVTNLTTAQIPSSIAKLSHLRHISITGNNLSGPIPSFLSQLRNLTYVNLSFNKLTGSIPASLSQLTELTVLHLERNKLTGQIPDTFGKFAGKSPPDLILSHNRLTGSVPKSLGDLNFTAIDFSNNKLRGDISFLFGRKKALRFVYLPRNMFEFDISKVGFPASLIMLDLNHNRITGKLPASLTLLELVYLNVSYNRLCGEIPTGGTLQSQGASSYSNNRCLCGAPLPACK